MKSTGMIRKIDELGRIVIPKEIRNNLNSGKRKEGEHGKKSQGRFVRVRQNMHKNIQKERADKRIRQDRYGEGS